MNKNSQKLFILSLITVKIMRNSMVEYKTLEKKASL